MSKHTAGPWEVRWNSGAIEDPELIEAAKLKNIALPEPIEHLTNDGSRVILGAEGEAHIAFVSAQTVYKRGKGHTVACPERDANATLIAAAPDLLAAARAILAGPAATVKRGSFPEWDALFAAIDKATGGS